MPVGDIYDKRSDPIETYFDTTRFGMQLPRRKWIVKPEFDGCIVPELDRILPGLHKWFECHVLPRFWQLLTDATIRAQCGTYFAKGPNWLEPPPSATSIDEVSEVMVPVSQSVDRTIVSYVVPDRHVATILRFGHDLEDATQWDNLLWSLKVSGRQVFGYQDFIQQRGIMVDPTPLASMIIVPHKQTVEVACRRAVAGAAINVFARMMGFAIPLHNVDQTGALSQWHTL